MRNLFRKRKDPVAMLASNVESIDLLIANGQLFIDEEKRRASIDVSLHIPFSKDEKRYAALMESIISWMQVELGRKGCPFAVIASIDYIIMSQASEILVVGRYNDGKFTVAPYNEPKDEEREETSDK